MSDPRDTERATLRIFNHTAHLGASTDDSILDTMLRAIAVGFGGEGEWAEKYGTDYENDVFLMHPYCWCEKDDCEWCRGCTCDGPWTRKIAGRVVDEAEHQAYWTAYDAKPVLAKEPPEPWGVWPRDVESICLAPCQYCRGEVGNAPNFLYKPTGFRVSWYKYIGRATEVEGETTLSAREILDAVFATHPTGMSVEQAIAKLEENTERTERAWADMMENLNVEASQ